MFEEIDRQHWKFSPKEISFFIRLMPIILIIIAYLVLLIPIIDIMSEIEGMKFFDIFNLLFDNDGVSQIIWGFIIELLALLLLILNLFSDRIYSKSEYTKLSFLRNLLILIYDSEFNKMRTKQNFTKDDWDL